VAAAVVGLGEFVDLAEEAGDVVQVPVLAQAAEDEFDGGGVPDGVGGVLAPPVPGLGQGLQDGEGGDAGAAAFGHQRRQRRERGEIGDLVQREQQRRVEACAGGAGSEHSRGFGDVFDERRHQRPRRPRGHRGGQQVEGAGVTEELRGVELLPRRRVHGGQDVGVSQGGQRLADAEPDGVAGSGVGVDGGVERVGPSGRRPGLPGEDRDGVFGEDGIEGPPVDVNSPAPVQRRGVQKAPERGFGLSGPEVGVRHAAAEPGPGGEAPRADERGAGGFAAADG